MIHFLITYISFITIEKPWPKHRFNFRLHRIKYIFDKIIFIFIKDTDDCALNPCQNGGSCVDGVDSFTCFCDAGFEGVNCQTGM